MANSRAKVFLFVAIACLYTSVCLSEYPQKEETVFSVRSSSDKGPLSRGSFLPWVSNLTWTNTVKRHEDPVIHMFGEGGDNEKIDLIMPGQELNGEHVSSFWAAKPPLEPYTRTQSPSSTSPSSGPPSPVPNSPPLVTPTPSPSAQSPSPLPPSAPISSPPSVSPSIPPPPSSSPSPTSFSPSATPSSTPYPFPSFPPSPITPSPSPPSFPSVTPSSTPSPVKPPSPTPPPTLPPPIFPPFVSPPINPPFVSPPIFPPFPSVSPPTFPPSPSPSPSVSPPIFPPYSSSSPSLPPPVFPPLPPQPPSQSPSPSPSPTPSPAPTSLSPSPTPSVTPPQPMPLPSPTPSSFPTPLSPTPSPFPTPLSPTPSPTSSPSPTPSNPIASPPTPTPSPVPTPSKISILTNLTVSNGAELVPDFNPFVFSYKVSFDSKVRRFLVVAYLPEDEEGYKNSSLHLESIPLKSGEKSPPLILGKRGETVTFHIYVRAVNHVPTTYVLFVTREAGHKRIGTVALIFVVLACVVGALILSVLGYAAYLYARTGRMLQLRDFQFSRGRDSSLYTPLIASGVTNDDSRL